MSNLLLLSFLLPLLTGLGQEVPVNLTARVGKYWDYLIKLDKASALQFVSPDSRNSFINRREPMMRNWTLHNIGMLSETQATVTVQVDRTAASGTVFGQSLFSGNWILEDGQWFASLAMGDQSELLKKLTESAKQPEPKPLSGELRVLPPTLKVWFLSLRQEGMVRLRNERPKALAVQSVEFDESRFRLLHAPETIDSGEQAELRIEYFGDEIKKNLESRLLIHYLYEGQPQELKIQVFFNYFSDGARGLFGLTKEEADKLPRGAVPKPVIKVPVPPGRQPSPETPKTTKT